MKTWHKILIASIILIIILYGIIFYVNQTLIPVKLKGFIIESLDKQAGLRVDIEHLKFGLARGFILKNVIIYESPKESAKPIFKAEDISFRVIFIPSFKKHRIIIPKINLLKPFLRLERSKNGTWNISSLFPKDKEDKPSRFIFIAKSLSLNQGNLLFKDSFQNRNFEKNITDLNGSLSYSFADSLKVKLNGKIDEAAIQISSRYKISNKDISIELDGENIEIASYAKSYLPADIAKVYSGIAEAYLKINIVDQQHIAVSGNLSLDALSAAANNINFKGNYTLGGDVSFKKDGFSDLKYNLTLKMEGAKVTANNKFLDNVDSIEGVVNLSENHWSTDRLSCRAYGSPAKIEGEVLDPKGDYTINATMHSRLSLKELADDVNIDIQDGIADVSTKITYRKNKIYRISGEADINKLKLIQKDIAISGNFDISGESSGTAGDWESLGYKGNMKFKNMTLDSAGSLPLISKANGKATFETDILTINSLRGNAAGTSIAISGSIDHSKKDTALALNIKADKLSLTKLVDSLPKEASEGLKGMKAEGICSVDINFKGIVARPETYIYTGSLLLKNVSMEFAQWPHKLSGIACVVDLDKRNKISANIKSDIFDCVLEINTGKDNSIDITKCTGRYRNSNYSLSGKLRDLKSAYADLTGEVYLNLKDSPFIFTEHKETLKKLKPEGTVKFTIDLKGPLKNPANLALFIEGSSNAVYLSGLKFKDFYIDYRMKDKFIDIPVAALHPYGGIININARANLKTEEKPYMINIDIKDVDLHELIKDTKDKSKKIKGLLASKLVLNGYLSKKDSLKGNGWLQVSDGYLWEFPVLHGIMDVILMVPPEYLVLTDAFGNFSIHKNRIYTEDFKILSKTASLLWVGSLGFDGTLDFNITGRFAEDIIKQTSEPGKIANAILRKAGSLIMEIYLTGTLDDPNYQIVPFPFKRIFQEKVVNSIKDIFGNINE